MWHSHNVLLEAVYTVKDLHFVFELSTACIEPYKSVEFSIRKTEPFLI